jgi:cation diffusion facilitator CzcD-associated flavoprotein CzcO/acetyl esterase/lipase
MRNLSATATGVRLPRVAVRAAVRVLVRPAFGSWVSNVVRRWWLDACSVGNRVPRGTEVRSVRLGGVPGVRVSHSGADSDGAVAGRAVLYLHGGGYTAGSSRTHRALAGHLSRAVAAPVFLLDYRLAPEHPYPAALMDVLAAYRALRRAGYVPERIVLAGDSAGGGLAVAAALALRDAGEPLPVALALLSPWLDLTLSGESIRGNASRDALLTSAWLAVAAEEYRAGREATTPGISPLYAELSGLPPMDVQAAGDELLVSDADRFVERARAAGVPVSYRRYAGLWHDFQLHAGLLHEADAAVADLGLALSRRWEDRREQGPRVAIIGAGFGGLGMGIALRRAGFANFTIFEKGDDIGGVWRDNTYPGAACDVPSHLYSFSFEPHREWSRRYSTQADILAYLRYLVDRYDLAEHLRLGTEVVRADFDGTTGRWRIELGGTERRGGETVEADVLVSACGQLSRPRYPSVPGRSEFAGEAFHSARWEHSVELAGKRVAVIGTGASAIQFVPAIAPRVGHLMVFQRSAPYVIPKLDRRYRDWHRRMFARLPIAQAAARLGFWTFFETLTTAVAIVKPVIIPLWLSFRAQLRIQIHDPATRAALKPNYPMGCKRILMSSDFYPALNRPNVELVTQPVVEITKTGVRTADGSREADVIIFGTGFTASDFLAPMEIRGLGGRDLNDTWRHGARAYLGLTVPGFPNLFLLYGPNTNLGTNSIIHMLESQTAYVIDALRTLEHTGAAYLDLRPDVEDAFDAEMQRRLTHSIWATGCTSWYQTPTGRIINNWPGYTSEYRRRTRRVNLADYHVVTAPEVAKID